MSVPNSLRVVGVRVFVINHERGGVPQYGRVVEASPLKGTAVVLWPHTEAPKPVVGTGVEAWDDLDVPVAPDFVDRADWWVPFLLELWTGGNGNAALLRLAANLRGSWARDYPPQHPRPHRPQHLVKFRGPLSQSLTGGWGGVVELLNLYAWDEALAAAVERVLCPELPDVLSFRPQQPQPTCAEMEQWRKEHAEDAAAGRAADAATAQAEADDIERRLSALEAKVGAAGAPAQESPLALEARIAEGVEKHLASVDTRLNQLSSRVETLSRQVHRGPPWTPHPADPSYEYKVRSVTNPIHDEVQVAEAQRLEKGTLAIFADRLRTTLGLAKDAGEHETWERLRFVVARGPRELEASLKYQAEARIRLEKERGATYRESEAFRTKLGAALKMPTATLKQLVDAVVTAAETTNFVESAFNGVKKGRPVVVGADFDFMIEKDGTFRAVSERGLQLVAKNIAEGRAERQAEINEATGGPPKKRLSARRPT